MWNIELWWWDDECQCNTLSLHLAPRHIIPPHFTLHHLTISTSHGHIPRHTIIPHHIAHFISHQHLSLFHLAIPYLKSHHWYRPHYASCHISHCIPFYITFHITPHSMYSTPHLRSRHILATLCITPPHLPSHHILHNIVAPHSASCIIPPHLTVITPNPHPATMFHITFHITHQYTTTFYIWPLSYHISHNTTSTTTLHNVPLTFHATALAPNHITPPLSITPFQFERLELGIWVILPKT